MSKYLAAILLATSCPAAYLDYSATYLESIEVELADGQDRIFTSFAEQIPRFDPALGKLRSVFVSLDLHYEWFWTIRPLDSSSLREDSCAFTILTGGVGLWSEYVNVPQFADCGHSQPDGGYAGGALPREVFFWSFQADTPGSAIGYFVGTTPMDAGFRFTGVAPRMAGGEYATSLSVRIDSAATVVYVYDQAPEPSMLLPVAVGLGWMSIRRRRRRGSIP